jgi:hypothetical protein
MTTKTPKDDPPECPHGCGIPMAKGWVCPSCQVFHFSEDE